MAQIGDEILRSEVVDKAVKQIAARAYKFKQAVSIVSTSAWKNTFFRETSTVLSGGTGSGIKGIPRGADFPVATPSWTEVPTWISKHGLQENILWEDILSDDIDVQARTLFKVTEGVVKSVDDTLWNGLSEDAAANTYGVGTSPPNIQSVHIAGGKHWSGTSAAIIDNLLNASQLIATENYSTSDLMLFVSPKDYRSIMRFVSDKGAQFPTLATEIAENGRKGRLAGMTLVESNSVIASYALVCVPKLCATWKELVPLSTNTTVDPFKSVRIRVVEEGTVNLTDPKAVVLLTNTQGPGTE